MLSFIVLFTFQTTAQAVNVNLQYSGEAETNGKLSDLNQYPEYFIGTETRNTQIIIPDEPTLIMLNAALELTNYLSNISAYNKVKLLKESQVKAIFDATIIIGQENQFKNASFNKLIRKSKVNDGLSLEIQPITLRQSTKNVLVVTGGDDAEFEKIAVLTEEAFIQQLYGSQLTISNMPIIKKRTDLNLITFKNMGIPSITLSGEKMSSDIYSYYIPYYPFIDMKTSIHLHLKISEMIQSSQKEKGNPLEELVLLVNDVPHSINLRKVKTERNGDIFVDVPLSKAVFTKSAFIQIQLTANGLLSNPEKWVYIDDSSTLNFHVDKQTVSQFTFRFFPFPKIDESVTIVVPDQFRWSDLITVYELLTINNTLPKITLVNTEDVKTNLLENSHVIFIGGKKQHKLLKDEVLAVHYNDNVPDLTEHGFFNVSEFAFIQNNPWDEDYALVVFDAVNSTEQYVPKEFAASLKILGDNANIVVNGSGGKLHTNEAQVTEKNLMQKLTTNMLDSKSFYLFFLFLFAVIALNVYVWRKRKKKK
ncbi:cellulose biosynthesis cyclic di-GMP-binding regulatory protein BcsB [Solibacillus faecavium]|uniref:cellulose biosynthesis cyclic di-GMP-binding regulatory protein BcsB n=1 Tax=Solibacillus faecavium TaxID=2762221 RepID=UPI001CD8D74C|nr:cellulose biosynthesis cyclic di-GMP-binding regulatory protein BcsB [Solibacillus faecavium]